MKKNFLISLMIIFLLVTVLSGCGKTNQLGYTDGTYEGTSDAGMHPGLKVQVVIDNGEISEVEVIENQETDGVGSVAVDKLPEDIVVAQSTEVDDISGATLTSTAIKEAVNNALEQSK